MKLLLVCFAVLAVVAQAQVATYCASTYACTSLLDTCSVWAAKNNKAQSTYYKCSALTGGSCGYVAPTILADGATCATTSASRWSICAATSFCSSSLKCVAKATVAATGAACKVAGTSAGTTGAFCASGAYCKQTGATADGVCTVYDTVAAAGAACNAAAAAPNSVTKIGTKTGGNYCPTTQWCKSSVCTAYTAKDAVCTTADKCTSGTSCMSTSATVKKCLATAQAKDATCTIQSSVTGNTAQCAQPNICTGTGATYAAGTCTLAATTKQCAVFSAPQSSWGTNFRTRQLPTHSCVAGQKCVSAACAAEVADAATCTSTVQCKAASVCAGATGSKTCKAVMYSATDGVCDTVAQEEKMCKASTHYCDAKKCKALIADGAACAAVADNKAASYLKSAWCATYTRPSASSTTDNRRSAATLCLKSPATAAAKCAKVSASTCIDVSTTDVCSYASGYGCFCSGAGTGACAVSASSTNTGASASVSPVWLFVIASIVAVVGYMN